jgi:transcriptional regulator with XRE-family HTH domain
MVTELDDLVVSREGTSSEQRRENRKRRYLQIREERGLDQAEMAAEIGVSANSWWFWETRGRMPRVKNLRRLHELTGRDHRWLRGE